MTPRLPECYSIRPCLLEQKAPTPTVLASILLLLQGCIQTSESSRKRSRAASPYCTESMRNANSYHSYHPALNLLTILQPPITLLPTKLSLWLTRSSFKSHPSELARPSHSFVLAITWFIPSTSHVLCLGQSLIHNATDSLELLISLG